MLRRGVEQAHIGLHIETGQPVFFKLGAQDQLQTVGGQGDLVVHKRAVVDPPVLAIGQAVGGTGQDQVVRGVAQVQTPDEVVHAKNLALLKVHIDVGFFAAHGHHSGRLHQGLARSRARAPQARVVRAVMVDGGLQCVVCTACAFPGVARLQGHALAFFGQQGVPGI